MKNTKKVLCQEHGLEKASLFGGTGNNTNAALGSCNANNSVATSNTNYAPAFALTSSADKSLSDIFISNSVINKIENLSTTTDSMNAVVSVSRATSEMKKGNEISNPLGTMSMDIPYFEDFTCMDNPAENRKLTSLPKGITTFCKHKRLRNMKAFLLNKNMIKQAIYDAMKNKDRVPQLVWIEHHIPETVERIYNEIKNETYTVSPYRFRTIKNKEEKTRHLAILPFYDRCVQQLFKNVIQAKLRAMEPRNVYSSLPGRGTLSNNPTYCLYGQLMHEFRVFKDGYGLKIDIHHCYESISTEIIKRELFKYVTDAFARRLVDRMLKRIKSLPIGDPLSGLYVNMVLRQWHIYLLNYKHHLFDRCFFFCDDALFLNRTAKKALHQLRYESSVWLKDYAGLKIKRNYKVYKVSEGITFCGARAFSNKLVPKQLIKKRMFRHRNNPRSLVSYKGILDKTNSATLYRYLDMKNISIRVKEYNAVNKYEYGKCE